MPMRVVTVNVPNTYCEAMERLVGVLYPSRSELIRCALRAFLIKELKMAQDITKFNEAEPEPEPDDENIVKVPIKTQNRRGEPVRAFKTYKILRKLEY